MLLSTEYTVYIGENGKSTTGYLTLLLRAVTMLAKVIERPKVLRYGSILGQCQQCLSKRYLYMEIPSDLVSG